MPTIKGTKFTEEHKRNLSLALMGKNKGKKMSLSVRKKMSESHKGIKFSEEHIKNIGKAMVRRAKEGRHPWIGKKHKADYFEKVSGINNYLWKGDKVSYQALHNWVARHRGRPTKCEFCHLEDKTRPRWFNWANKSGKYLRDLNDWLRLCVPCHKILDKERRKNAKR